MKNLELIRRPQYASRSPAHEPVAVSFKDSLVILQEPCGTRIFMVGGCYSIVLVHSTPSEPMVAGNAHALAGGGKQYKLRPPRKDPLRKPLTLPAALLLITSSFR